MGCMKFIVQAFWRILRFPLLFVALCLLYFGGLQLFDNFHAIVPGEVYRSAQLSAEDIAKYKETHGIRAVLNLRGENIGADWYDEEVAGAKAAGVEHLNFRMSSKRELTEARAQELIAMMRDAPKPLLIHCRAGADRTGLASVLYLAAVEKAPLHEAKKQLSPIYGHLPLWFTPEYEMDRSFERLKPMLGYVAE